jgi:hypothetical protein
LKSGDIVFLSRYYFDRSTLQTAANLNLWLEEVERLNAFLIQKQASLFIFGPPPIFTFNNIESCSSAFGNCEITRSDMARKLEQSYEMLNQLQNDNKNTFIVDSFSILCPIYQKNCSPYLFNRFTYRDRDHLNSYGSIALKDQVSKILNKSQ